MRPDSPADHQKENNSSSNKGKSGSGHHNKKGSSHISIYLKKTVPPTTNTTSTPASSKPKRTTASVPAQVRKGVTDSIQHPAVRARAQVYPTPAPLVNRANPIAKKFETGPGEIRVELFDYGNGNPWPACQYIIVCNLEYCL
jgi:hypothetical protein